MPSSSYARMLAARLLASLTALACGTGAIAAPQSIAYRWPAGQTLRYRVSAAINGKVPPFDTLDATLELVYAASASARDAAGDTPVKFRVVSADAEIANIPYEVPEEQAHRLLDQSVVLKPSGEVVSLKPSPPLPFTVSIPGIDLKQLHTLLVPVVFPEKPIQPGDTWSFTSALMGKDANSPYKATLQSLSRAPGAGGRTSTLIATVRTEFSMDVDQKLDKDKKPAKTPEDVVRTRKGKITGSGDFRFDVSRGRLLRGDLKVSARIDEDVLGPLESPDDPRHLESDVNALIKVAPDTAKPAQSDAKPKHTSGKSSKK